MFDAIEKILNAMMLVGLSIIAMAYFSMEPTLAFIKGQVQIKEELKKINFELKTIKQNINNINLLINTSTDIKSFDLSSKIQELNNAVISNNEKIQAIKLLIEKDPSTLANLRKVNLKYNTVTKNLDKLNTDMDRTEDKIYSNSLNNNSILWGVLLFLGGLILHPIVNYFKKVNKTKNRLF
ncbi:MAG: hypothetical protein COB17_10850 [Sulfurimonas sp.]|nr:MAG: hypothetical protein COB17_10850 [Sulfurimonas sp.]